MRSLDDALVRHLDSLDLGHGWDEIYLPPGKHSANVVSVCLWKNPNPIRPCGANENKLWHESLPVHPILNWDGTVILQTKLSYLVLMCCLDTSACSLEFTLTSLSASASGNSRSVFYERHPQRKRARSETPTHRHPRCHGAFISRRVY